jgi:dUTP pyrophosphatase
MEVKIVNKSNHRTPEYESAGAAGFDLKANIDTPMVIEPLERVLVPTGIFMELPHGYECQIRPRSGMAYKYGMCVANAPGTIDEDYRGEIKVIMINLSKEKYIVQPGDRIAQGVINKVERAEFKEVRELSQTERGEGGFGHTGKQ